MRKRQLWRLHRHRKKIYFNAWRRNLLYISCENMKRINVELEEEINMLEENALELRDQRDSLKASKSRLESDLEEAKNLKLRQSDAETALRRELSNVKRSVTYYEKSWSSTESKI